MFCAMCLRPVQPNRIGLCKICTAGFTFIGLELLAILGVIIWKHGSGMIHGLAVAWHYWTYPAVIVIGMAFGELCNNVRRCANYLRYISEIIGQGQWP